MYPRIARKGTSFKGAALYYLHDKDAQTNDRVEFTHTQNLHTDDPEMAWKMMAYTAMNQNEIKKAAGVKNTGNKAKSTVYSYSLSWKPSERKDEFNISAGNSSAPPDPTMEEMIKAGLDTLKIMGLHEHESMIVGHNDTKHPHIHVIVNRVHPDTGIIDTHSNDKLKLSKWAEKHERDRGQILCKARAENNERRRKGEYVKFRENHNKAEYYRWQREKTKQACEQRQKDDKNLSAIHKRQRDRLYFAKEKLVEEHRKELKETNRPKWTSIYKRQEQENQKFDKMRDSALASMADYIKNRNQERKHGTLDPKRGLLSGAYNVVNKDDVLSNDLNEKPETKRSAFGRLTSFLKNLNQKRKHGSLDPKRGMLSGAYNAGDKDEKLSNESHRNKEDALSKKHKEERKAFAEKIAMQSCSTLKEINDKYFRDLEVLKANQIKEQQLMKARHSEESQKRAMNIASGKAKEEFARKKRMETFRKVHKPQNDNKPPTLKPDLKEDFNKKKEKRAFRFVNDNRRIEKTNNQETENKEKDSDVKKEFNKFRFLPNHQEKEKKSGRFTGRSTSKDTGIDRGL